MMASGGRTMGWEGLPPVNYMLLSVACMQWGEVHISGGGPAAKNKGTLNAQLALPPEALDEFPGCLHCGDIPKAGEKWTPPVS